MFWTRRSKKAPTPSDGRLPAAQFLALVREALEEVAPGFTEGVVIKDDLMVSPHDWAVVLLPPRHSTGRHYDLIATPDLRLPGEEWTFADCVTAFSADERDTAASWAQTTGACLVELVDGRGHFAERVAPGDAGGVPGWGLIVSGAIGFGHDVTENHKLQGALLLANVLPRTAHTFTADLTSPHVNGVKVFYGGAPGAVQAEVRVNGERHEAASAALAALGLPEPAAPAVARYYALMLPLPQNAELFADRDEDHADHADHGDHGDHADGCGCGGACGCGGRIDPEHPGFLQPLPDPVLRLPEAERAARTRVDTGAVMAVEGVGNFLKVRLPVRLEDGRTVNHLLWARLDAATIEEVVQRVHAGTLTGHRFAGTLANGVRPWDGDLLDAPVVLEGRAPVAEGAVGMCEVVESERPVLAGVLAGRWPAEQVLGERDPRLRTG